MPSEALLAMIAAKRGNPYDPGKSVEILRAESNAALATLVLPDGARCVDVDAGGTPAEWVSVPGCEDATPGDGAFMFIHGGGYYRGSRQLSRATAAWIARESGLRVLSIDYRLAPEHPFPAAVDDTQAAWRWLLAQGCPPERAVVGGVSAGGGLTLALLLRERDANAPLPRAAVPLSAWTDMLMAGSSFDTRADADPSISRQYLEHAAAKYLGDADPRTPEASPMYGDLNGLPPLLMQVGDAETLLDDSVEFARRARAQGVDVTLEQWPEMIHGWHMHPHLLPEARDAIRRIGAYCRERVAG